MLDELSVNLNNFDNQIRLALRTRLGYPGNQNYDYTSLLSFLNYTLNNSGDPYVEGIPRNHSKQYERECIAWFSKLYELEQGWGL